MLKGEPLSDAARAYPGLRHAALEGTVLATILNRKVEDLARAAPATAAHPARRRSLIAALSGPGRHFILECKRSSPSLGDFCADFDLDRILGCYKHHAHAISVLCEEHFFRGSLEFLRYVREHCELPVLCKDFIIAPAQLDAAAAAGADAVLLMLSVLDEELFPRLYAHARKLGLEVLCEAHTASEVDLAVSAGVPLVGINNRDLTSLKIDLGNAPRLAKGLTDTAVAVAESGLTCHRDLVAQRPVHNFLIGSALTGAPDLEFAANTVLYGVNKICGLKTAAGIKAAVKAHAALAGFIFAPRSPRCLSPEEAAALLQPWRGRIRGVGVFVDADAAGILETVRTVQLDYVQLHGQESPALARELRAQCPKLGIIKAVSLEHPDGLKLAEAWLDDCDYLLLDAGSPGSGRSFDWQRIPASLPRERTLLSGGLGADNLAAALAEGFAGLDLNSRLESAPGVKDPQLIEQAFAIINAY